MKKLILSAMASLLLFACQSDNSEVAVGEGKIAITVTTSADVATRAEGFTLQTPALSDFQLLITGENFSKSWASVTDYRTDDERYTAGGYTVAINAGDATVEGYGKSAFAASEQVTVLDRNRTTEVKLTARLANAIVEVRTTEMFDNYFPQSEFSVTTAANTFEWNKSTEQHLFVAAEQGVKIDCNCVRQTGKQETLPTQNIADIKAATRYILTYDLKNAGGVSITVKLNQTIIDTIEIENELNPNA